jgi:hypothetical protein
MTPCQSQEASETVLQVVGPPGLAGASRRRATRRSSRPLPWRGHDPDAARVIARIEREPQHIRPEVEDRFPQHIAVHDCQRLHLAGGASEHRVPLAGRTGFVEQSSRAHREVHSAHGFGRRAVVSAAGRQGLPQRKPSSRSSAVRARLRGNRLVGLGGENVTQAVRTRPNVGICHTCEHDVRASDAPSAPSRGISAKASSHRSVSSAQNATQAVHKAVWLATSERIRRPVLVAAPLPAKARWQLTQTRLSSCVATRISWTRDRLPRPARPGAWPYPLLFERDTAQRQVFEAVASTPMLGSTRRGMSSSRTFASGRVHGCVALNKAPRSASAASSGSLESTPAISPTSSRA